jgi:hypothetical protein
MLAKSNYWQDSVEAMKWYRLAAEQANTKAQVCLGLMYEYGEGVLSRVGIVKHFMPRIRHSCGINLVQIFIVDDIRRHHHVYNAK